MRSFAAPERRHLIVFRIAALAWLVGWYAKAFETISSLGSPTIAVVDHILFPSLMKESAVSFGFYLLPSVTIQMLLLKRRGAMILTAVVMLLCSLVLMLHVDTYNDATFVTSFWVGLWLLWLAWNAHRPSEEIRGHGILLAKCTLGVVFLGGAVGKFTAPYWSGEIFYQLYFMQKTTWPYTWLREAWPAETLRTVAIGFSRFAIVSECFLALSPLMPIRFIGIAGPLLMLGVVGVSTWSLISVMACLMGMMIAAWYWSRTPVAA